ncbi:hypothetical protein DFH07DRAFT_769620 [Mycena maculata]|uniref:Uncharacterized protein n=1 Tax=Mycena maculata TaxID=230809 RepID=A0AAD7JM76_9AGAR|nr:hypothetical protein DFH07DRAFT_769620 [Mycena maculata]
MESTHQLPGSSARRKSRRPSRATLPRARPQSDVPPGPYGHGMNGSSAPIVITRPPEYLPRKATPSRPSADQALHENDAKLLAQLAESKAKHEKAELKRRAATQDSQATKKSVGSITIPGIGIETPAVGVQVVVISPTTPRIGWRPADGRRSLRGGGGNIPGKKVEPGWWNVEPRTQVVVGDHQRNWEIDLQRQIPPFPARPRASRSRGETDDVSGSRGHRLINDKCLGLAARNPESRRKAGLWTVRWIHSPKCEFEGASFVVGLVEEGGSGCSRRVGREKAEFVELRRSDGLAPRGSTRDGEKHQRDRHVGDWIVTILLSTFTSMASPDYPATKTNITAAEVIPDTANPDHDPRFWCLPPVRDNPSEGRVVGIWHNWTVVDAMVSGFPGGAQRGHHTRDGCVHEWQEHCALGLHPHPMDPRLSAAARATEESTPATTAQAPGSNVRRPLGQGRPVDAALQADLGQAEILHAEPRWRLDALRVYRVRRNIHGSQHVVGIFIFDRQIFFKCQVFDLEGRAAPGAVLCYLAGRLRVRGPAGGQACFSDGGEGGCGASNSVDGGFGRGPGLL